MDDWSIVSSFAVNEQTIPSNFTFIFPEVFAVQGRVAIITLSIMTTISSFEFETRGGLLFQMDFFTVLLALCRSA